MTELIPTNGGKNIVNNLDIKSQVVVVFNMDTLEILDTCENYTVADEKSCDLYHQGIDARFDCLSFFDDTLDAKNIIGFKLSQFQDFVDNNKHPLLN